MAVINFGSLNIDYVYAVPHFCEGGETLTALGRRQSIGGKGLNQSVAAAHAGADVFHAGLIGPGGEILRSCLEENGVDTSLLRECGEQQGHAIIQVSPGGQNCILVFGGSNRAVTGRFIDETLARTHPGDYLLLQNEISGLPHLLRAGAEKGLKIVLNASPIDDALLSADLSPLDWLVVNELECARVAGVGDTEEAYRLLCRRYPGTGILLTLGEKGSVCFRDGREYRQAAYPAKAVDTTGAGDTFMGYFVAGLRRGRPIPEIMRLASMASSIAVSRPGAAQSIPLLAEAEAAVAAL